MKLWCYCLMILMGCGICNLQADAKKVIFDTDMGNDVDDVLAQLMLYHYGQRGEMDLLAIGVNKATLRAAMATEIFASFYGHSEIPIGLVNLETGKKKDNGWFLKELFELKTPEGNPAFVSAIQSESQVPNAVKLFRQILSKQPDQSVNYISVGFLSNLADLLKSGPDENSPLSGKDLVAQKVKQVSLMAGSFKHEDLANPGEAKREFNVHTDQEAGSYVFENCPVPMIFSGHEVGASIRYPREVVDQHFGSPVPHPVHVAYVAASKNRHKNDGRYDWATYDLTSVLWVMEPELFRLSEPGVTRLFDQQGRVTFTPDPAGKHFYLKLPTPEENQSIQKRLVETTAVKPKK